MTTFPHDMLDRLGKATGDVSAARARLRKEQEAAWQRFVTTVNKALTDDLDLTDEHAATDDEPDPVPELLDAVHGRIDDLRVQSQLGRMEAGDVLEQLQAALRSVIDRVTP